MTAKLSCPAFTERLVDLSDGELPLHERPAVEEHLENCSGCREELARLNRSLACLQRSIIRSQPVEIAKRRRTSKAGMAAAVVGAGTALAVIALIMLRQIGGHSDGQPSPVANQAKSIARLPATPAPKLSESEALWRIALNEQQARLQTSLDLLPRDERDGDQRRETEEIVERIRQAAGSQGANL